MFWGFLRIVWKSGSRLKNPVCRPRCRTMLKILWNTQKTPTKQALRHLIFFLKILFLAEKSGSRLRCRIKIKKYHETLWKHQRNKFWGYLRNFWKSGSMLKNPVLCSDVEQCYKIPWNTQKTPPKHVLILNNLLAMVRCLGQPTLFIILQMICTDQIWGCCWKYWLSWRC